MTAGGRDGLLLGRPLPPRLDGLRRGRLVGPIAFPTVEFVKVVAPAGAGKTTLLSHLVEARGTATAWLSLDHAPTSPPALLARLADALAAVVDTPDVALDTTSAAALAADLEGRCLPGALLVLDDLHAVRGTPAEAVVDELTRRRPGHLSLALGSRTPLDIDVRDSGLRGAVRTVGADQLRFRTWEVEELLRLRRRPHLPPGEVALLVRRTDGWAAALQLFDLATARMPPSERARLLHDPVRSGSLTREYLVHQVVAGLPSRLRGFVLRCAVLRRLTPGRCAALLGEAGGEQAAAADLADLADRGLVAAGGPSTGEVEYRHHEVLSSALLALSTAELGPVEVARLHRQAGRVSMTEGDVDDAVRSFAVAGDWEAVRGTIAAWGRELADRPGWLDVLPAGLVESDPWVVLAVARRIAKDGDLDAALDAYRRAETLLGSAGPASAADERRALAAWVEPPLGSVDLWVAVVRRAMNDPAPILREPSASVQAAGPALARGLTLLVAGRVRDAVDLLATAAEDPGAGALVEAVALLALGAALSFAADPRAPEVRSQAVRAADSIAVPALQRLAEGIDLMAGGQPPAHVERLIGEADAAGDRWGAGALRLAVALAGVTPPSPSHAHEAARHAAEVAGVAAAAFSASGAAALATWACVCEAVAARRAGAPAIAGGRGATATDGAPDRAGRDLVRRAAQLGPLPEALAALATSTSVTRATMATWSSRSGAGSWLRLIASQLPVSPLAVLDPPRPAQAGLTIRCLGGFAVSVGGHPVDLTGLRPRHQSILRALCVHAVDRVLHRETLMEWFWPDQDPARSARNLHTAVSAIRRVIDTDAASTAIRRDGENYRLDLRSGSCDVTRLRHRLAVVPAARAGGPDVVEQALAAVLDAAAGDLLPEEGPSEWVVAERDRLRTKVSMAAAELMTLQAAQGREDDALRTAWRGLDLDADASGLQDWVSGRVRTGGAGLTPGP